MEKIYFICDQNTLFQYDLHIKVLSAHYEVIHHTIEDIYNKTEKAICPFACIIIDPAQQQLAQCIESIYLVFKPHLVVISSLGLRFPKRYSKHISHIQDSLTARELQYYIHAINKFNNTNNNVLTSLPNTLRLMKFTIKNLNHANQVISFISLIHNESKFLRGLYELILNALEHGVAKFGYEHKHNLIKEGRYESELGKRLKVADNNKQFVSLSCLIDNGRLVIQIDDYGDGFDYKKHIQPNQSHINRSCGQGLAFAYNFAFEHIIFENCGATIKIAQSITEKATKERLANSA